MPNRDDSIGAQIDAVSTELNTLLAEAEELGEELSSDPTTALVAVTAQSPAAMKKKMAATRSMVMKKKKEIESKQSELKDLLERKMHEINQVIGPMNAMVKRLEEGIWTFNLYLGRDEYVIQLRDGTPADASTPIYVRQLVLAMDEECAVAVESGGIDAMSIEEFDEWLLADEAHLNQVFPEPRGVMALVPRWADVDYGNPWESAQRNQDNKQTYFLVRNGERLYRYVTDFVAGERLIPSVDEFTDFFYERAFMGNERKPIKPDTRAWEKAEANADARKRHYMRVGLILQGLVDRTTVFHPLPGTVRFLEAEDYDEGRIVIIADGDNVLSDGREGFRDWQRRLMHEIRPGMRIIAAVNTYGSSDNWSTHPKYAPGPEPFVPHTITERVGESRMRFAYDRTDMVLEWLDDPNRPGWMKRQGRHPARRASCTFYIDSEYVLPFDLIDVEDIDRFLNSRSERHRYVDMFPLLKATRRAILDERAQEAPFRLLLTGVLSTTNNVPLDEAEAAVPTLIDWWKTSNRHHRPLIGSVEDNAKAVRMIVNEHRRRLEDIAKPINGQLIETLKSKHPEALLVARRREGTYVVLEPQDDGDIFVTETTYSARGVLKECAEWQLIGTRPSRWVIAYESEQLATWNSLADQRTVFTGPEIVEAVKGLVKQRTDEGKTVVAVMIDGTHGKRHRATSLASLEIQDYSKGVDDYWSNAVEHPLTANYREPGVSSHDVKLRRNSDGLVTWNCESFYGGYPTGMEWPIWEPSGRYAGKWKRLWLDESVADAANVVRDLCKSIEERARHLGNIVHGYEASVCVQYNERQEQLAYEKFLEEYLDPDLWEGHRKILRINLLGPGQRDFEDVEEALELLVESGHVLDGLTVREVMDRAKVLCDFDGEIPEGLDGFIVSNAKGDESDEEDSNDQEYTLQFSDESGVGR